MNMQLLEQKQATMIHHYFMALNTDWKMKKQLFHIYPRRSYNRQMLNATPSHSVSSASLRIRLLCITDRGVRRLYILISWQCHSLYFLPCNVEWRRGEDEQHICEVLHKSYGSEISAALGNERGGCGGWWSITEQWNGRSGRWDLKKGEAQGMMAKEDTKHEWTNMPPNIDDHNGKIDGLEVKTVCKICRSTMKIAWKGGGVQTVVEFNSQRLILKYLSFFLLPPVVILYPTPTIAFSKVILHYVILFKKQSRTTPPFLHWELNYHSVIGMMIIKSSAGD